MKYRNKKTGEIIKAEIRFIPEPEFIEGHDILLNHYPYELYFSPFKKILFKELESIYKLYEKIDY